MKQLNTFNFILSGFFVLLIALTFSTFSQAEEVGDQKINVLESQMSQLIESQNELTLALKGVVDEGQQNIEPTDLDFQADVIPEEITVGDGTGYPPHYLCTSGHQDWPSSEIYKDVEWSLGEMYGDNIGYYDINGDGLVDYFYRYSSNLERHSCVMLNNGSGWDLVSKCYAKKENATWTFWGDCAQA